MGATTQTTEAMATGATAEATEAGASPAAVAMEAKAAGAHGGEGMATERDGGGEVRSSRNIGEGASRSTSINGVLCKKTAVWDKTSGEWCRAHRTL